MNNFSFFWFIIGLGFIGMFLIIPWTWALSFVEGDRPAQWFFSFIFLYLWIDQSIKFSKAANS